MGRVPARKMMPALLPQSVVAMLQSPAKPSFGGGLGFGDGATGAGSAGTCVSVGNEFPTAISCPQSLVSGLAAKQPSVGSSSPNGLPEQQQQQQQQQVPAAKSTYREGRLRTTVNTPETLVTEV